MISSLLQATLAGSMALALLNAQKPATPVKTPAARLPATQATVPKLPVTRVDIEKYPDGSLKKETPYLDGKIHGEVREYWPGGKQLKSLTRYEKGLRQGMAETYFENGRVETRVPFKNDRMEGRFERLDNPGAKRDAGGNLFQPVVIEQTAYVNGLKEGVRKTWRRVNDAFAGELASEATYRNDQLDGEVRSYGPGDGRSVRRYVNGLQEGLEEHFSATGKLEVNWKADKKHGLSHFLLDRYGAWPTWEEEWSTGALVWRKEFDYFLLGGLTKVKKIETFNNAHKLHGKSEFWREADKREKTLEYVNGLQHGFADFYDEAGEKVIRREEWRNGVKVGEVPVP